MNTVGRPGFQVERRPSSNFQYENRGAGQGHSPAPVHTLYLPLTIKALLVEAATPSLVQI
jgi:hypothetical protein